MTMIDELLSEAGRVPEPSADTLARGRAVLAAAVAVERAPRAPRAPRARVVPAGRGSRRLRFAWLAAVAAATIAAVSAVLVGTGAPSARAVTLASFTMPTFPFRLDPVPDGLAAQPSYSGGQRSSLAVYHSARGDLDISVSATNQTTRLDGSPAVTLHDTTVNGNAATEYATTSGVATFNLAWQARLGQWVVLTGTGALATPSAVRAAAAALVADPQPVRLQVHLAPAGWQLDHYKDGSIISLQDPAHPDRTMTVSLIPALATDLARAVGAKSAPPVTVNGQAGQVAKTRGQWIVEAYTPTGAAFRLQAPADLTVDQVSELAASVTTA